MALAFLMFCAMALSGCLLVACQAAYADPVKGGLMLAPGKPAGIAVARSLSNHAVFVGLSIGLTALVVLIPASGTTTATATSTTATGD